jgi:hypothetical protein
MLHEDGGYFSFGGAGEFLELGKREFEFDIARKRRASGFRASFAAGGTIERSGGARLPGCGRDARASAGKVDGDEHGAFPRDGAFTRASARWAASPSLGDNGLRTY